MNNTQSEPDKDRPQEPQRAKGTARDSNANNDPSGPHPAVNNATPEEILKLIRPAVPCAAANLATPEEILELVRSSRRGHLAKAASEAPWADKLAAIHMLWRGVSFADVFDTFGITGTDFAAWTGELLQNEERFSGFECNISLMAIMLDQVDPERKMRAQKLVCVECLALVAASDLSRDIAKAVDSLSRMNVMLEDDSYRTVCFEPLEEGEEEGEEEGDEEGDEEDVSGPPSPTAVLQFHCAYDLLQASRLRPKHSPRTS
jgi:hypothetical protein